jgi:hypothetical protein
MQNDNCINEIDATLLRRYEAQLGSGPIIWKIFKNMPYYKIYYEVDGKIYSYLVIFDIVDKDIDVVQINEEKQNENQ